MNLHITTPPPPRSLRERIHEIAFLFVLCLAQFLALAAMNQTVAPLLILAKYFNIDDYGNLSWFSAAYSMTVGTFILPAGRLGDIYGHKIIFLVGWAWFGVWSLAAGFCTSDQLVLFSAFRALQGIGPALLIPNAIAIIGRTFPIGFKRNIAFACFGAAGPAGAALGAVMAALVSETITWPWCFWLLAITCALLIPLSYFVIPAAITHPHETKPLSQITTTFDYPGAITGVAGLILINFALNQAPISGWSAPYIPSLLAVGVFFLAAFVYVELRVAAHPIVPLRGLQRNAALTLACVFAGWSSHGIWVYYLYIFLEHLRGHSALLTSFETSPVAVSGVLCAFITVYFLRTVTVSWIMFSAMCFFTFGSLVMAVTPIDQPYWTNTFFAVFLMPAAMNQSFPAATILLSETLPRDKQGIAASLVATVVNYSISCGLGLAGSIHRHSMEVAAKRADIKAEGMELDVVNDDMTAVRLHGLRSAYWFAVILGGVGMVIAAFFILVQRKEGEEKMETRDECDSPVSDTMTEFSDKGFVGRKSDEV
ncbi:hypothetical protein OQA88_5438 [Cercophora sp. LCS_1]